MTPLEEQLQAENATLRNAQKACETCDAPTMAELTKLREEVERLNDWKVSAMRVFPDFQAIGQLLNVQLGEDVSSKIIPGIKDLQSQLTQAQGEVAERDGSIQYYKEQLTQAREELAHTIDMDCQKHIMLEHQLSQWQECARALIQFAQFCHARDPQWVEPASAIALYTQLTQTEGKGKS